MYSIGVIGLGQIAYSIDNDPNRVLSQNYPLL
jgi:hypothetical protein